MNTRNKTQILIATLGVLAAPLALHGQVQGAVQGAAGVTGAAQRPLPQPPPPAVTAGAAAGATGAVGVQPGAVNAAAGLHTDAAANASVMGQTRGLSVATLAAGGASVALDGTAMASRIRDAAHANRDAVLAEVETRVAASMEATTRLRRQARGFEADTRAEVEASLAVAREHERAVNASLREARRARGEEARAAAQEKLAADYEAYARAVTRAEAAAQPAIPATPGESPATPATPSINAEGQGRADARAGRQAADIDADARAAARAGQPKR